MEYAALLFINPRLGVCKKNRNRKPNQKIEETEPKNRLTEKNFKKIGSVNRTGKKFRFSVQLRFGQFENSVNRTEIRNFKKKFKLKK